MEHGVGRVLLLEAFLMRLGEFNLLNCAQDQGGVPAWMPLGSD
jgi:hypothetical protein